VCGHRHPAGRRDVHGHDGGEQRDRRFVRSQRVLSEQLFRWTPATSGTATIDTCGPDTNYDTVLYVRKDDCFGPELACNDDSDTCPGSRVTPTVVAGESYLIVVDGFGKPATSRSTSGPPRRAERSSSDSRPLDPIRGR